MEKASKPATSPISYFLACCANNDLADIDSKAKKRKKKKKNSTEILHYFSSSSLVLLLLVFSTRVHFLSFAFFLNGTIFANLYNYKFKRKSFLNFIQYVWVDGQWTEMRYNKTMTGHGISHKGSRRLQLSALTSALNVLAFMAHSVSLKTSKLHVIAVNAPPTTLITDHFFFPHVPP